MGRSFRIPYKANRLQIRAEASGTSRPGSRTSQMDTAYTHFLPQLMTAITGALFGRTVSSV